MADSSFHSDLEELRMQDLDSYEILDTLAESEFDALTRLAQLCAGTPVAFISFIDRERQWFKSSQGLKIRETLRSVAFCDYTIKQREALVVEDAREAPQFRDNPLVTAGHGFVFYAGVPLISPQGHALGTLAVIDYAPRKATPELLESLKTIAGEIMLHLLLHKERLLADRFAAEHLEAERRFKVLLENLPGMVYRCRLDQRWTMEFISEGSVRITGYRPEEFTSGRVDFVELIVPEDREMVANRVDESVQQHAPYQIIYRILNHDGDLRWVWEQGAAVRDRTDEVTALEGFITDITEHKQAEQLIQHIAYHDSLTGLANRSLLNDRLAMLVSTSQRKNRNFAVLFLDLDRFKYINDILGHVVGDKLLQQVGTRLKACVREMDTVARVGGDEFIIVLPDTSAPEAAAVAQKILGGLAQPFQVDENPLITEASIGIALFPQDGRDSEELLRCADIAMFSAKDVGRNTYRFFTQDMAAQAAHVSMTYADLRNAIARDELFLHYQPQVDLRSGRLCGLEALLRWQHPDKGLVSPAAFIPLAEENGQIIPIGQWVLSQACRQLAAWRRVLPAPFPIAVNVSTRQLCDPDFPGFIRQVLQEHGLAPADLELEITEGVMLSDAQVVQAFFRDMQALGIPFAIDDFGTGYSSLSYLKKLPVTRLKIDQSFVRDIGADENDDAVVRSIIGLAHQFRLRVIAEGVETEAQLRFLREQDCDEVQGYFICRPVSPEHVLSMLRERTHWLAGPAVNE